MSLLSELVTTTLKSKAVTADTFETTNLTASNVATDLMVVDNLVANDITVTEVVSFQDSNIVLSTQDTVSNVLVGTDLPNLTSFNNICVGMEPGTHITTGIGNICFGTQSGSANTTYNNNIALGRLTINDTLIDGDNICIGEASSYTSLGGGNVAIGTETLYNGALNFNVALGAGAGANSAVGSYNVLCGLNSNSNGDYNVCIGNLSDCGLNQNCIVLGSHALATSNQTIAIGNGPSSPYNRLFLGFSAGSGGNSNIIPGPFTSDVLAGAGPAFATPLGGLYFDSVAGASELNIRLT